MANMYRSVLASGGTAPTGDAIASDVLTGKTFSNAQATGINGTMPNNGAVSGTATPAQPYTIPAGYHNGNGVVTASGGSPRYVEVQGGGSVTVDCAVNDVVVEYGANAYNAYSSSDRQGFTKSTILNLGNGAAVIVWKCTTGGQYTLTNTSGATAGWFVCNQ